MRKTALQKWNEISVELDMTRKTVKSFTDAKTKEYGSHSYAAGYLESMVAELIMQLPKAKRAQYRAQLSTDN